MFSTVKRILRSKLNIIENFNTAEKCNQTINIDFDKKFDETIELTEKTEIGSDNNKFFIPKDIILGLIASVESNIN